VSLISLVYWDVYETYQSISGLFYVCDFINTGFTVPTGEKVLFIFAMSFLNYDQQQKCSANMNSQIGRVNGT
jgi:hypothetical protein